MKILNSMFFSSMTRNSIGLVLIENDAGEKKGYIGVCEGESEAVDIENIINFGAKVPEDIMKGAFLENFITNENLNGTE